MRGERSGTSAPAELSRQAMTDVRDAICFSSWEFKGGRLAATQWCEPLSPANSYRDGRMVCCFAAGDRKLRFWPATCFGLEGHRCPNGFTQIVKELETLNLNNSRI